MMMRRILIVAVVLTAGLAAPDAHAEPQWISQVIATGVTRHRIESTPITHRPYRPFHFYGNTVRRVHYRGQVLPRPTDFREGARALIVRR